MQKHLSADPAADLPLIPPVLTGWLAVFRPFFTAPTWQHVLVLVLVAGAVLAPGKRTVTQVLRVMGLADRAGFARYHEVLNRAQWDARALARQLLLHVLDRLLPSGPVVIGIDDTVERRRGVKIKARGIYRDPVRSSKGHFVKTSGLRWLSLMVVVPIPWSGRHWALPFLTILAPSARWSETHRQTAQDADRLGAAGDPSDQALAAQSSADLCRRQRLCRAGTISRSAQPCLRDHPASAGCRPLQAGPAASEGPA
jgi:hypothetical protein